MVCACTCAERSGYVDVATATGDERPVGPERGARRRCRGDGRVVREAAEQDGRELAEHEYGPAVPAPRRILCLGVNYVDHALEGGRAADQMARDLRSRSGLGRRARTGTCVKPGLTSRFDYEGELGIVIGKGGRYIRADDALDAIAGYFVVMDGTAREWQRAATQWTPGKNFDGTMPIGPEVVTTDEIDVSDLQLTTTLNGEVMQSASTAQMIFDIPRTIEYLSSFTTLRPGDVIATGTPGGVGFARTPPVWLTPGD